MSASLVDRETAGWMVTRYFWRLCDPLAKLQKRRLAPSSHAQESSDFNLTAREREVLAGIASGERSKEVAARLGITRRTVESYLNSIYTKLNVDSRAAAVAIAIERGLLPRRREET